MLLSRLNKCSWLGNQDKKKHCWQKKGLKNVPGWNIARNLGQDSGHACASFLVMAHKVLKIMYGENNFFENISFSMQWIPCAQLETYSKWTSRVIDKEKRFSISAHFPQTFS